MEEAIEILWSYARREPLDSNGETIVPSVNNSIAAIRLLSRLEGWEKESEKRTVKPSEYMELGYVGEKRNPCWRELAARAEDTEANKVENTPYSRELVARAEDTEVCKLENAAHPQDSSSVFPNSGEKETLLSFTRTTLPSFTPAPFHEAYYDQLTQFAYGHIKKLMITMPPQHGKSEGATRRLPAFILGHQPDKRIAIVSYNAIKARKFNRELQRIIDDDTYHRLFPQTLLAGQTSSSSNSIISKSRNYARNADECEIVGYQGSFKTIGVGGSLTGEPVDVLIMDDLYKDAAAAWSPLIRQNIADWYDTVASTRLHNDSQQLLVFTRWHMEDLAGRLLEQEGEYDPIENPNGWVRVSFPAIQNKEPTALDPREEGEALWPERHSAEKLLAIKERNPAVFESLYQQDPKPNEGLMYDEFNCYMDLPSRYYTVAYIDTADSGSDYLCALFYREAEEGNYILDVLYTKDPMEVTEKTITYMLEKYKVERCHIESNNGGGLFASNLQQQAYDRGNHLTRFYPFHQNQNKTARIFTASASVQKLIWMPVDWKQRFPKFAKDLLSYLRIGTNPNDDAPDALTGSVECRQPPKRKSVMEILGYVR